MDQTSLKIDWDSADSQVLLNPRLTSHEREWYGRLFAKSPVLPGHIWLATSGTTGRRRLVGLSKEALLCSAVAVNAHLQSTVSDRWILALPTFHVGGLGILARAFLSGASVHAFSTTWNPEGYVQWVTERRGTLSSLVPTQVYDLIQQNLSAPPHLRAVVVGGGALAPHLYLRARRLGWNLLPSYGLTECGSQVATSALEQSRSDSMPPLKILSHLEVRQNEDSILEFRGESLLTGYAVEESEVGVGYVDPKKNGWFVSEDRGVVDGGHLTFQGREGDIIKVGSENVDVGHLETILHNVMMEIDFHGDAAIVPVPDARLGMGIHLAIAFPEVTVSQRWRAAYESRLLAFLFNRLVLPFERIRKVHRVPAIPRSSLGKLLRRELKL